MKLKFLCKLIPTLLAVLFSATLTPAQTPAFTYQGSLKSDSSPANGMFDFQFAVYTAPTGGLLQSTNTINNVPVTNGIFTVSLDATTATFDGDAKYLEIRVKPAGGGGAYETLTPRQLITSAPYAVKSLVAEDAVNANTAVFAQTAQTATTAASAVNVTGTVAVTNGGTGATDAGGARMNLGLGSLATVTPTGAADNTKFLRGDNAWTEPPLYFNATLTHRPSTLTSHTRRYYPNGVVSRYSGTNSYFADLFLRLPRACRLGDFKVTNYNFSGEARTVQLVYASLPSPSTSVALSVTLTAVSPGVGAGSSTATLDVPADTYISLVESVVSQFGDNTTTFVSFTCR